MPRSRSGSSSTTTAQRAKPNCKKGFSCGASCINRNRQCLNPLQGQARTYGEFLQNALNSGVALSPYHQGAASVLGITPTPTTPRAQRSLPEGVETHTSESGNTFYYFKAGNSEEEVVFEFSKLRDDDQGNPVYTTSLLVGEDYDNPPDLSPEDRAATSLKIRDVMRYQVEQMGEGSLECWADSTEDQDDGDYTSPLAYSARAYEAMGFSRPYKGLSGETQYAVVKDGKIDREASRQKLLEDERLIHVDSNRADQEWASDLRELKLKRAQARQARRQAAMR